MAHFLKHLCMWFGVERGVGLLAYSSPLFEINLSFLIQHEGTSGSCFMFLFTEISDDFQW